jgi:micrococcal nuclease
LTPLQLVKNALLGLLVVAMAHLASYAQAQSHREVRAAQQSSSIRGTVIRAADGDTLKVKQDYNSVVVTVRLLGVDTPETHDPRKPVQCYGPEAANFTAAYSKGRVLITTEPKTGDVFDRYGRVLGYAYSYAHKRDIGATLLRRGFARVYAFGNRKFLKRPYYEKLQAVAQAHKIGRWGHC